MHDTKFLNAQPALRVHVVYDVDAHTTHAIVQTKTTTAHVVAATACTSSVIAYTHPFEPTAKSLEKVEALFLLR